MKLLKLSLIAVLVECCLIAEAQTDVSSGWANNADGNWSAAGNWTGSSGAPTGATGVAYFTNAITGQRNVTLDVSPWVLKSLVFTNNSSGNSYGWSIQGGVFNLAASPFLTVNGSESRATIGSGLTGADFTKLGNGTLILTGTNAVGPVNVKGSLIVSDGGTVVSRTAGLYFGNYPISSNCSVIVTGPGSKWDLNGMGSIIYTPFQGTGINNRVVIANGGIYTNGGLNFGSGVVGYPQPMDCALIVTNGGKVYLSGGAGYTGNGCSIFVGTGEQPSIWDVQNTALTIAESRWSAITNSSITVDRNGVISNASSCIIGRTWDFHSVDNKLIIKNGGVLRVNTNGLLVGVIWYDRIGAEVVSNAVLITDSGSELTIAGGGIGVANLPETNVTAFIGNSLTVLNDGLLESVGTISVGYSRQKTMSNYVVVAKGGILQFVTNAPTFSVGNYDASSGNGIIFTNAIISYRSLASAVNLTNNWVTNGFGLVTWQGANTLRLNNSTVTNSVLGGYTFANNLGATNYAGLQLIQGATALTGNGITIGASGGSLLFSNTSAAVQGVVTNYGTMTTVDSTVMFLSDMTFGTGCVFNVVATNQLPWIVNGVLTLTGGRINLPASLAKRDSFALFSSSNIINGNLRSMSLSSPKHKLERINNGKTVIVKSLANGSVLLVR